MLIVGRRGPLQAPFTTLELRELGHLEGLGDVDVVIDPADFADISDEDVEAAGKTVRNNIKVLRGYAEQSPKGAKRRIVFRFRTSPIEIKGEDGVESIVLGRNELATDDNGRVVAKDAGEREEVPAQLVVVRSATAACQRRACRSTRRTAPFRTPAAGWTAAATDTWWAG